MSRELLNQKAEEGPGKNHTAVVIRAAAHNYKSFLGNILATQDDLGDGWAMIDLITVVI